MPAVYERILVALDGSERAERVLPYVAPLADKFGASVTLLRATTSVGMVVAGDIDPTPLLEAERQEATAYLAALAARLAEVGLTVSTASPEGPAADALVEHARRTGADLIALTTHGRGGLGRLLFGSVADAVLRHAPCPVLLVRLGEATGEPERTSQA